MRGNSVDSPSPTSDGQQNTHSELQFPMSLSSVSSNRNPNANQNVSADWLEAQAQAADAGGGYLSSTDYHISSDDNNDAQLSSSNRVVEAMRKLTTVIELSQATSMNDLVTELTEASDELKLQYPTHTSLTPVCNEFVRCMRRNFLDHEDFNLAKSSLVKRAEKFLNICCKAPLAIAKLSQDFIFNGPTILVHGFSGAVLEVLKTAAQNKTPFRVLCTEGRPDRTGLKMAKELSKLDIPVKLLIDSAVAYIMNKIDMVLVGADGVVVGRGGIINTIGTYQIALVAQNLNKPVYVAAESYKFSRDLYPFDQKDFKPVLGNIDFGVPIPPKVEVETSTQDYTPPQYLTNLWTDLGSHTPSVVSDVRIRNFFDQ